MATGPKKSKGGKLGKYAPYLIGGAAILGVVALAQRGGGGGGGGGADTSGLLAQEISVRLSEEREAREAELGDVRAALTEATTRLSDTIRLSEQRTREAIEGERQAQIPENSIAFLLRQLLDRLNGTGPGNQTPPPPAQTGPRPTAAAIRAWEQGINLPEGWGYFFVDNFGRLPNSIPELEAWRAEKAIPSGTGGWCIHWGGELKCL